MSWGWKSSPPKVRTGDADFKSQLTNIAAKTPDVVFCPNYYEDDGLIVTQARDAGLTATFMGGDGWASVSQFASAEDLEGAVYCSAYAAGATPELVKFEADYTEEYGKDTLNMFAPLGYDAASVMLDPIADAEAAGLTAGPDEYSRWYRRHQITDSTSGIPVLQI
jgi:branched-chain amino acid transport system substrate-binding protein